MLPWSLPTPVWIVLGLAAAFYFLLPLVILATFRFNDDADVVPWDPLETPPPDPIARYLRETEEMLIDAGFRCIGGFVLPNSTPNAKAVLRAYVHDENRDTAMVNVVFAMVAGRPTVRASFAEFESEFTTGNVRSIETNNNSVLSPFPVLFDRRKARFPYIRDLGYLYQLHQALVMQHAPGERKALRLVEESPDDASAFIREVVVRETLRRQETTGYLRYSAAQKCWRATILGAYLMTWKQLWPINWLRQISVRRTAHQLENELGVSRQWLDSGRATAAGSDASDSQKADAKGTLGAIIGAVGFLIGVAPTIYIACIEIVMWYNLAMMNPRPKTIRPMGLAVLAGGLTVLGLFVCYPAATLCRWLARRLGAPVASEYARIGASLFFMPMAITMLLVLLMCLFTGVRLGD